LQNHRFHKNLLYKRKRKKKEKPMAKKEEAKAKVPEIQLVIFRLRDEEFGVAISEVREIVRMMDITRIPEAPGFIEGVINLRGQVIAVIDLARQFGLASQAKFPKTARIVVIEVQEKTVGLIVDEVPEVLRISQDNIEPTPEVIETEIHKDYLKGVGKLEDRLIILLDLEKVLKPHEVEEVGKLTKKEEEGE
jgi:purine-binding chemotaxis protein CheW